MVQLHEAWNPYEAEHGYTAAQRLNTVYTLFSRLVPQLLSHDMFQMFWRDTAEEF